jgi:hypothetical protein
MGLFDQILPEVTALGGIARDPATGDDALAHTLLSVRFACSLTRDRAVRAAALLHSIGKGLGAAKDGTFHENEAVGAGLARSRMALWAWPRALVDSVSFLIHRQRLPLLPSAPLSLVRLARLHGPEPVNRLFSLSLVNLRASGAPLSDWQANRAAFLEGYRRLSKGPLPLNGRQVMELLGIPQGPLVGRVLSALERAVAEGVVTDADEAQSFLLRYGPEGFTEGPSDD